MKDWGTQIIEKFRLEFPLKSSVKKWPSKKYLKTVKCERGLTLCDQARESIYFNGTFVQSSLTLNFGRNRLKCQNFESGLTKSNQIMERFQIKSNNRKVPKKFLFFSCIFTKNEIFSPTNAFWTICVFYFFTFLWAKGGQCSKKSF